MHSSATMQAYEIMPPELFDLRRAIDGTALGLLAFLVPVQTKACDPNTMNFLYRSIFCLHSIMVAGLMVSATPFL